MMKVVLKVELKEDRIKKKAMKAVSSISGIESISVDAEKKELTITGYVDPVHVVCKLKKCGRQTDMVFVGPAKEDKNKDETKVAEAPKVIEAYPLHYHMMPPQYPQCYYTASVQEDPVVCPGCVIC